MRPSKIDFRFLIYIHPKKHIAILKKHGLEQKKITTNF